MAELDYKEPRPTNVSKVSVSTFAEGVARKLSYSPGSPIEFVVSQLGGGISFSNPVGEKKPESIRVEPDRSFKIFLPSMTSAARDRFTIAHELGHFFLHFPRIQAEFPDSGMIAYRWVEDGDQDLQRCEWEANWFAAAFVMPEASFKESYKTLGLKQTAIKFGVSEKACQVRASNLHL